MSRTNAIWYLYLPYLAIVITVAIVSSALDYVLFSRYSDMPLANSCGVIPGLLLIFTLLSLYRPVSAQITSTWSDRLQGFPVDILFALPSVIILQLYINGTNDVTSVLISVFPGQWLWLFSLLMSKGTVEVAENYKKLSSQQLKQKVKKEFLNTFHYLIPTKEVFITPLLVFLLFGIYLATVLAGVNGLAPAVDDLVEWGAAFTSWMTAPDDDWRLFTAGFIHRGLLQLAPALVGLVACGRALEKLIGAQAIVVIFIVALMTANVTAYMKDYPDVIAGSHVAVAGLVGAMFFYALFDIGAEVNRIMFVLYIVGGGACVFVADIFGRFKQPPLNIWGITGGFIGGIIAAIYYIPVMRRAKERL
jgi:membrane associated rhomboid family serine protease